MKKQTQTKTCLMLLGRYKIVNYYLPDSILVREMIGDSTHLDKREMLKLANRIQRSVLAYHRRKAQISAVEVRCDIRKVYCLYLLVFTRYLGGELAALAQMVACLPLVQQVRGSIPSGVVNFHLKIFNLGARRGGDVHFLIARLYITILD